MCNRFSEIIRIVSCLSAWCKALFYASQKRLGSAAFSLLVEDLTAVNDEVQAAPAWENLRLQRSGAMAKPHVAVSDEAQVFFSPQDDVVVSWDHDALNLAGLSALRPALCGLHEKVLEDMLTAQACEILAVASRALEISVRESPAEVSSEVGAAAL